VKLRTDGTHGLCGWTGDSVRTEFDQPETSRYSRTTGGSCILNHRSDSSWLWALHRNWLSSTTAAPPSANGTRWWNSRNPCSVHRPRVPTNAHWPSSRFRPLVAPLPGCAVTQTSWWAWTPRQTFKPLW